MLFLRVLQIYDAQEEINLEDETPFKEPYRHIPQALMQEVREHPREMHEIGLIRLS